LILYIIVLNNLFLKKLCAFSLLCNALSLPACTWRGALVMGGF
jgi:hypothetical protein